jgi:uncharacterized protein YndB with AHSA1/START domain
MTALPHQLDRTITIGARPETVFSFFTDDERWASWWGAGSAIDARPGGRMRIRYPNGVEVSGEVVDVHPPDRIVFTYGYDKNLTFGPGASRVTIRLEPAADGTRLSLKHEFAEAQAADRDHHVQGWRYQLSLFANLVTDRLHAGAAAVVDRWFAAWSDADAASREQTFTAIARSTVRFHDRFSCVDGIGELVPHVGAAIQFMPGMRIARAGDLLHCQGTVVANWIATGGDGQARGKGLNVFQLGPDGLIDAATGLWS